MNYVVIFEKSATGWGAQVPDLPSVITKEKAQTIELHLDGLREDNLPIPEPSVLAEVVTVFAGR